MNYTYHHQLVQHKHITHFVLVARASEHKIGGSTKYMTATTMNSIQIIKKTNIRTDFLFLFVQTVLET